MWVSKALYRSGRVISEQTSGGMGDWGKRCRVDVDLEIELSQQGGGKRKD